METCAYLKDTRLYRLFPPKVQINPHFAYSTMQKCNWEYILCERNKMDKISLPIDNWFTTNYGGQKGESLRSVSCYFGLARRLEDISTTVKCKVVHIVIWMLCWDIKENRLRGCTGISPVVKCKLIDSVVWMFCWDIKKKGLGSCNQHRECVQQKELIQNVVSWKRFHWSIGPFIT